MKNATTHIMAVAIVGLILAAQSPAQAAPAACDQVVQSMKNEWKAVDFQTPSKPTAMRVEGKMGHENTAAQVSYMQEQIKLADNDCRAGNGQSALQRVSSIHDLLDSHGISQETANAAMIQQ